MEVIDEGINALVRQNIYSSKEAVITDAVRALLELKPGLKIEIAINLYKNSKVSLWKAAETAGLGMEEFKDILSARNIKIEIGGTKEESKQRIKDALHFLRCSEKQCQATQLMYGLPRHKPYCHRFS